MVKTTLHFFNKKLLVFESYIHTATFSIYKKLKFTNLTRKAKDKISASTTKKTFIAKSKPTQLHIKIKLIREHDQSKSFIVIHFFKTFSINRVFFKLI